MIIFIGFLCFISVFLFEIAIISWHADDHLQSLMGSRSQDAKRQFITRTRIINNDENSKPMFIRLFAGLLIGFAAGYFIQGIELGVALGGLCLLVLPKVARHCRIRRFQEDFSRDYPQAMTSLAAAARVGTLAGSFAQVAVNYPPPVATVFTYIDIAQRSNLPLGEAVQRAADHYHIPVLNDLAETVRSINEFGAGNNAGALLEMAADETRFEDRHRMQVRNMFGEMRAMMRVTTVIPIAVFGILAIDSSSDYRETLIQNPTLFMAGVGILCIGWIVAHLMIGAAEDTA